MKDSFYFSWVHSSAGSGSRVHSGSRGFTRGRVLFAGLIKVRVGHSGARNGLCV